EWTGRDRPRDRHRPARGLRALLWLVPALTVALLAGEMVVRAQASRASASASYAAAEFAMADHDYDAALLGFAAAGDYRDARSRHDELDATIGPLRLAYLDALAAFDARRYDTAVALLEPVARDLPGYRDTGPTLAAARRQRDDALLLAARDAERRRDWLAAEQALATLAAFDPADAALATRLRTLRQSHAPLAVARPDGLYLVGPDGDDERLVTDALPATFPAWNPARTRIAFLSPSPDRIGTAGPRPAQLTLVVPGEGGLVAIATGFSPTQPPVWSPDGGRIAVRGLDGSLRIVQVTTGIVTTLAPAAAGPWSSPTWSPSGHLVAAIGRVTAPGQATVSRVVLFDAASGATRDIGSDRLPDAVTVAWNPTDLRLLVHSVSGPTGPTRATRLTLIDLATGEWEAVAIGTAPVATPAWSPMGDRVAYVEGDATLRIRRLGTRGESTITVAHPLSGALAWAPDGSAVLAFGADPEHPATLVPMMTRAGEGPGAARPVRLGRVLGDALAGPPAWAPTHAPSRIPVIPPDSPPLAALHLLPTSGPAKDHPG
ncbi:MAG: hypothetical protein H0U40_09750, partial [Chloroflexia bacterium]|nr:hypothetical protein [Chloroflexia bacterium]